VRVRLSSLLQVMSALHMIMQKWKSEAVFHDHPEIDPEHVQLRAVMLGKLCGAIIGENGKTISDIKMATSTDIRVQVCKLLGCVYVQLLLAEHSNSILTSKCRVV
jgi:hypothetical protein